MSNLDSHLIVVKEAFDNVGANAKFASSEVVISRLEKLSKSLSSNMQERLRPLLISAKSLTLIPDYGEKPSSKWEDKPDGRKARDEEATLDIEPSLRSEWPEIPEGNKAAGGCGCGCGGECIGCKCETSRKVRAVVRKFVHANPKIAGMLLETLVT